MFDFLLGEQKQKDAADVRIREISVSLRGFDSSFLVQQTFDIKKFGTCPAGKILRGNLKPGATVHLSGFEGKLEGIEAKGKTLEIAQEGDFVALRISGLEMPIKRGDILHFK